MTADVVTSYTVYGRMATAAFQQCTEAALYLNRTYAETFAVSVLLEVPRDFQDRRAVLIHARKLTPEQEKAEVLVHNTATDAWMTAAEFLKHAAQVTHYRADPTASDPATADQNVDSYKRRAARAWLHFLASRERQYCWMDVQIDHVPIGRIWFELFSTQAPLTCKNFCALCRGITAVVPAAAAAGMASTATISAVDNNGADEPQHDKDEETKVRLAYKGTRFFRILKDAWVMAGDVTGTHGGDGGYSCFGRCFPDETFAVAHDAKGVLGMCNDGPHTNASSFYITQRSMPWMNRRYMAFGRVMDGMDVVDRVHACAVKHNQAPVPLIEIADCGVLDPSE